MAEKFVVPIHGSDHCPGGPDPIPCLGGAIVEWGNVAEIVTLSVATGSTGTFIQWQMDRTPPGNQYVVSNMATDATKPFKLQANGWYSFIPDVEFTGAGYTDVRTMIITSATFDTIATALAPSHAESSPIFASLSFSAGPIYIQASSASPKRPQVKCYQGTGISKDIATGYFTCIYWGDTDEHPYDFF